MDTTQSVIYQTFELTNITEGQFATMDAIANLSSQLTQMGVIYEIDWKVAEVFYDQEGKQCINIEFKDEQVAMLVKLRGVKNTLGHVI